MIIPTCAGELGFGLSERTISNSGGLAQSELGFYYSNRRKPPLQVLPTLAKVLGLNEAIFLQQLHYMLRLYGKDVEGQTDKWMYRTLKEWGEQFPFWSIRTIQRIVKVLEKKKLVKTGCFNRIPTDQTLWYAIDYAELAKFDPGLNVQPIRSDCLPPSSQPDLMTYSQSDQMLPKNKTTNHKKQNAAHDTPLPSDHQKIVQAYVEELGYNPPNGAIMGKAAKWLAGHGYTPEQVRGCYRYLKAQKFYQDKMLGLQVVQRELPEYIKRTQAPTPVAVGTMVERGGEMIRRVG